MTVIGGNRADIHNPIPVNLYATYPQDIAVGESDMGDFSGSVTDLFDNLQTTISDTTANNPKQITIAFNRTIASNAIGLGAVSGDFSNVKIEISNSGGEWTTVFTDITDGTKETTATYQIPTTAGFNGVRFSFHTTDTVTLSNCVIFKAISTVARTQAAGPDNVIYDTHLNEEDELKVSMAKFDSFNIAGATFDGNTKDTNFWAETVTGSGSVTQAGEIQLSTGTTADSTVKYTSVKKARFIVGTPLEFKALCEFYTVGDADNIRRIGAYDDNNGVFFQLDGTTLSVVTRSDKTGSVVDTKVDSGSFNGYAVSYTVGTGSLKLDIKYGGRRTFFFINNKLYHTVTQSHDERPTTLTYPITMENINDNGNTTDNEFHVFGAAVYSLGAIRTEGLSKFIDSNGTYVLKYGPGVLHHILNCDNSGSIDVYDGTSTSGAAVATVDTGKVLGDLPFETRFSDGLTVVVNLGAKVMVKYE